MNEAIAATVGTLVIMGIDTATGTFPRVTWPTKAEQQAVADRVIAQWCVFRARI